MHSPKRRRFLRRLRACCVACISAVCLVAAAAAAFPGRSCADGGAGCGGITDDAVRAVQSSSVGGAGDVDEDVRRYDENVLKVRSGGQEEEEEEEAKAAATATATAATTAVDVSSRHGGGEGGGEGDEGGGHPSSAGVVRGGGRVRSGGGGRVNRRRGERVIPAPGHRPAGEANLIVIITPTYERPSNKAPPQANMLLAMRNMLCSSRGHQFLWVLVMGHEDYTHVDPSRRIPKCSRRHTSVVHNVTVVSEAAGVHHRNKHRGVDQRNAGLAFIRDADRFAAALRDAGFDNVDANTVDPVVYFGDDDNEYDPLLWDEMVEIKKLGAWPVGFPFAMAPYYVETVSVDPRTGKVRGYNSLYCDRRLYNMDMASFATRLSYTKGAVFKQSSRPGHIEDDFLQMVMGQGGADTMEILAGGCYKLNPVDP
jgi:hypothetical protein